MSLDDFETVRASPGKRKSSPSRGSPARKKKAASGKKAVARTAPAARKKKSSPAKSKLPAHSGPYVRHPSPSGGYRVHVGEHYRSR